MRHLIVILLFPIMLSAQSNAYEALIGFKEDTYQPFAYEYQLCPWQSFRLITNFTFQIDLICNTQALHVLQAEPDLFMRALEEVYRADPLGWEHIELIKRWSTSPGKYKIHIPGLVGPYEKYWRKVRPTDKDVLDITKQGYHGWYYKPHPAGFGLGVKMLGPDEWHVSGAMFLKQVIPGPPEEVVTAPQIGEEIILTKKQHRELRRSERRTKRVKQVIPN